MILLVAAGAAAATTNDFVASVVQGRELALKILEQRPSENFTNAGVLKIQGAGRSRLEIPIQFCAILTPTSWRSVYAAQFTNGVETLAITHPLQQSAKLEADFPDFPGHGKVFMPDLSNQPIGDLETVTHSFPTSSRASTEPSITSAQSFASSDFSVFDLSLEFFHWPQQKILKKEVHRSCGCAVLESTNPHPTTNGYSRVVSWIDEESLGIVEAYAYAADGKKLKDFYPKDFKKVNGQWQVQSMVMENLQTGSRSRLEFDLQP
jgi:hypothetical protein